MYKSSKPFIMTGFSESYDVGLTDGGKCVSTIIRRRNWSSDLKFCLVRLTAIP